MDATPQDTTQPDVNAIALTPDSTITHVDDLDQATDKFVWRVLVDEREVATFEDSDENSAEDLVGQLRARLSEIHRRRDYIAALREVADFIDEHPEVPIGRHNSLGPSFYTLSDMPAADDVAVAIEALDARLEPAFHAPKDMIAVRDFGPISYEIRFPRALICEERPVTTTEFVLPESLAAREQKAA